MHNYNYHFTKEYYDLKSSYKSRFQTAVTEVTFWYLTSCHLLIGLQSVITVKIIILYNHHF